MAPDSDRIQTGFRQNSDRYRQIQTNADRIQTDSASFRQNSDRFRQIQTESARFRQNSDRIQTEFRQI